jgi:hypothetical protein
MKMKITKIPITAIKCDPVGDMLARSDDIQPYIKHYAALMSGGDSEKTLAVIAALPKDKRYLSRVLQCLAWALADFDSETVKLDLPYMDSLDAIKEELAKREWQLRELRRTLGGNFDSFPTVVEGVLVSEE